MCNTHLQCCVVPTQNHPYRSVCLLLAGKAKHAGALAGNVQRLATRNVHQALDTKLAAGGWAPCHAGVVIHITLQSKFAILGFCILTSHLENNRLWYLCVFCTVYVCVWCIHHVATSSSYRDLAFRQWTAHVECSGSLVNLGANVSPPTVFAKVVTTCSSTHVILGKGIKADEALHLRSMGGWARARRKTCTLLYALHVIKPLFIDTVAVPV